MTTGVRPATATGQSTARDASPRPRADETRRPARWPFVARALKEFVVVPAAVVAVFLVLAVVSILADQAHLPVLDAVRRSTASLIGQNAATSTLQAVATGLVTVTSITFSVLLLAVQQTASNLSPVVFDQFVRRKSNQAFLGFFVGLALFAYVVMVAVGDKTPPIIGAAIATVLTVVALLILLLLVYSTVSQMRPTNVMRQIHRRTLAARGREGELLRRTRREEQSSAKVTATCRASRAGYVNGVDLDRLAEVLEQVPGSEIRLHVTLGQHVAYDGVVATVRDDDEDRARRMAGEVAAALLISGDRDIDYDATTGIDEIGNIAWTSGSTAKQNPEVARQALQALHDLATRWLVDDPAQGRHTGGHKLAIVYPDNDLDRIFDVFYSLLVSAHESHQHMTAARVLDVYADLAQRAETASHLERLRQDVDTAAALLDEMPPSRQLRQARQAAANALGL